MSASDNGGWWSRVRAHPYFWFAAPIILGIMIPALPTDARDSIDLAFSTLVMAPFAIMLSIIVIRNHTGIRLPSESESIRFFPFRREVRPGAHQTLLVDHEDRLSGLLSTVRKAKLVAIVAGASGVGKSTLIHALSTRASSAVITAENSFPALCDEVRLLIEADDGDLEFIAIDQAERFRNSFIADPVECRGAFADLAAALRSRRIRIIFSVRSDLLATILDFMLEQKPTLHFLKGIEFEGKRAFNGVVAHFDALSLTASEREQVRTALSVEGDVNSFAFQTAGYLVEALTQLERRRHFSPIRFDAEVITIYLSLLFGQYSDQQDNPDLRIHVETVLFCIAEYNRRHGLPMHDEQIAQVSSMPPAYVCRVTTFLLEKGIIESTASTLKAYFVSHDLISATVLDSLPKYMRHDYRLGISELIGDRDAIGDLPLRHVETNPFARIFTSSASGPFVASVSLISIWVAVLAYSVRLGSDQAASWLSAAVPASVKAFGGSIPLQEATRMFPAIYLSLYCWIIFMYGLDRGYFYYLYKERAIAPWAYLLVHVAGPIGIVTGFVSSVAPALFVFGVILPGLFIASAYANAAFRADNSTSLHSRYSIRLAWQTVLNMFIAFLAWYVIMRTLEDNALQHSHSENLIIVLATALIFTVFAFAMRERQGSETGHWVLLAVYAASRRRSSR